MILLTFIVFNLCPPENVEFVDESANCVIMCYKGKALECASGQLDEFITKRFDYDWVFYHR